MRSRADQLDRKKQVDAAFFERMKENHKKTNMEALKNSESQISDISADNVNAAKRFYEELRVSIPTDETLLFKFLQHVPRAISSEYN